MINKIIPYKLIPLNYLNINDILQYLNYIKFKEKNNIFTLNYYKDPSQFENLDWIKIKRNIYKEVIKLYIQKNNLHKYKKILYYICERNKGAFFKKIIFYNILYDINQYSSPQFNFNQIMNSILFTNNDYMQLVMEYYLKFYMFYCIDDNDNKFLYIQYSPFNEENDIILDYKIFDNIININDFIIEYNYYNSNSNISMLFSIIDNNVNMNEKILLC